LAETIADEVLVDRFVWCRALGWMGWTGRRWKGVTDETVGEECRQYVLKRFQQAATAGKSSGMKGWHSILAAPRQRAVLTMAKGIVERPADAFDCDLDLLNTPNGIVHLPSGQTQPHDPELLITKITRGEYRPD